MIYIKKDNGETLMIFVKIINKNLECFVSCPIGHLVDSVALRGKSFSERMERSEIPQHSENHYWSSALIKRRFLSEYAKLS
jgi:hypothetical protein